MKSTRLTPAGSVAFRVSVPEVFTSMPLVIERAAEFQIGNHRTLSVRFGSGGNRRDLLSLAAGEIDRSYREEMGHVVG